VKKPTEAEINAVAAAMWNDGSSEDGRPQWLSLSAKLDAEIIADMKKQARAGIDAFLKLRAATK
jgi:hypothetical protein